MSVILHITTRDQWQDARRSGVYRGDTLDSEGFIHCSTPRQAVGVAAARFAECGDLVLLAIDTTAVRPEIRHEGPAGGEQFPHIYGPLNLDAVTRVVDFAPGPDGRFTLPAGLPDIA